MTLQQQDFEEIEKRIGREHLGKRLRRQVKHSVIRFSTHGIRVHWENLELMQVTLKLLLKMLGLFERGRLNTIDYRIEETEVCINGLPESFHGFRILQLSDLHIDAIIDGGRKLKSIIGTLDFDLCVLTGDFRFLTYGSYVKTIEWMSNLVSSLQCKHGIFGILGNHDFIEMVPELEAAGIRMLLNESIYVKHAGDVLWIAGVDDSYYYEVHDIQKALRQVPDRDLKILLSHSPEIFKEASLAGIDYYICGHSHGGQICLPGNIPVVSNSACPRKHIAGPWKYKNMTGYTSRGVGFVSLPARFYCPPEIALHRLVRA